MPFRLSTPMQQKEAPHSRCFYLESGSDLSSRAVSSQVLSALKGLTAVFGMGTGGTPSSLPPEMVSYSLCRSLSLPDCRIVAPFQSSVKQFPARFALALPAFPHPDNCTSNDSISDRFPISLFFVLRFPEATKRCNQALDLLVSSSCIRYRTSTDDLSTW